MISVLLVKILKKYEKISKLSFIVYFFKKIIYLKDQ
ncbi:hypothetical protein CWS_02545 [Buchnera aphidicola str. JF99 (Acyrthosiphon pisum)]|nr:hypothetical protein CWO_02600 [Buchnera aphidicola str. LL01 (Acyrthosiphon pisum)]ADP66873.1 hypothetical protein CWQ_02625 [Buchnera aphidicola str. TLW03 (Acyrthosiphon pisum)]ADP67459.1 hypothetical protein CWS_02545 [Buchnera aphidicola str. JF99 (Acyrthosiphon pisum)]ADP67955.1 hypothetical protein CWU_03225 [Buchnera aphidicola str. JF98 (Acyrthosiphon pisum)]